MSGVMAGLIGSFKAVVADLFAPYFMFYGYDANDIHPGSTLIEDNISAVDAAGNIYMAGGTGTAGNGMSVSKFLPNGTLSWKETLQSVGNATSWSQSRIKGIFHDGTYLYVSFTYSSSLYAGVVQLNPATGAINWQTVINVPRYTAAGMGLDASTPARLILNTTYIDPGTSPQGPSAGKVYWITIATGAVAASDISVASMSTTSAASSVVKLANNTVAVASGEYITTYSGASKGFYATYSNGTEWSVTTVQTDASNNLYLAGLSSGGYIIGAYPQYGGMIVKVINTTTTPTISWGYSKISIPSNTPNNTDLGAYSDRGNCMVVDPNGTGAVYFLGALGKGVTALGKSKADGVLIKFDLSGNMQWARQITGAEKFGSISLVPNGTSASNALVINCSARVLKIRANGDLVGSYNMNAPYTGASYYQIGYLNVPLSNITLTPYTSAPVLAITTPTSAKTPTTGTAAALSVGISTTTNVLTTPDSTTTYNPW